MNKELEELFKGIFVDRNHTKRSINADKQLEEQDIKEVYSIIEKEYEEACEIMKRLIKNRKTVAVPLLYRKVAFLLVCTLCYRGEKVGAQKRVLEDLELSHNSFSKWDMEPIKYFEDRDFDVDEAPSLNLKRFGKKNNALCKEFVKISSQVSYSTFVDVFTGLGTITATKPKRGTEYINDYDNNIFNFLLVIRDYPQQFAEVCKRVINDLNAKNEADKVEYLKQIHKKFEEKLEYANYSHILRSKSKAIVDKVEGLINRYSNREKDFNRELNEIIPLVYRKIIKDIEEISDTKRIENINRILRTVQYYTDFKKQLEEHIESDKIEVEYTDGIYEKTFNKNIQSQEEKRIISEYAPDRFDGDAKKLYESNIELAVAFYFYHCFDFRGKPSRSGIQEYNLNAPEQGLESISDYSKRLKKVKILHQDFRDVIRNFNQEETLLYLDSPYIATEEYEVGFYDDDHIDMINLLKSFKGKWIFSCRASVANEEDRKNKALDSYDRSIGKIASHLSMFRNGGYFVLQIKTQGNLELMITNFEFIHENIQGFDEFFTKWAFDYAQ